MKLEDLESIMDEAVFVAFLGHFGGRRLYVPKNMGADHPISLVIGLEAATALSDYLQGESVDLPTLDRYNRRIKRRKILELRKKGVSFDMIAWEIGCSRRFVIQICADGREEIEAERPEPKFRQLELF
ncbi:S1 domain-containing protein [Desulforegula conservatrix]|uniref:hypothetical protein n=1 Tax=Desulforegula conservatrix TaxID=153026 RepID=UPI000412AFB3|nr:hypothetical protein [Desulforegula conservatrix]